MEKSMEDLVLVRKLRDDPATPAGVKCYCEIFLAAARQSVLGNGPMPEIEPDDPITRYLSRTATGDPTPAADDLPEQLRRGLSDGGMFSPAPAPDDLDGLPQQLKQGLAN